MAKMMPPIALTPARPGVSKVASPLAVGDRWIDSDKVMFIDDRPEKLPGWTKKTVTSVTDTIRGVLAWSTMSLSNFIGLGTYRHLYVCDEGLDPFDITPIQSSGTLTDPFTVTSGSATVQVAHTAHTRNVGDEVIFSGASEIDTSGVTPDGSVIVTSILDDDNYFFENSVPASADGTGGGSVDYQYVLPIGATDPLEGDGFGAGGYGLFDYGAPTEDVGITIVFDPRVWNLAKYGDLMLANPVNAGIYVFDPADTPSYQRAVILENAPTVCRALFVTPERFIFALGVDNDPMNIKWPDQDDETDWTPDVTNTANSRRLVEGSKIVGGAGIANLISGVWTDTALYKFQYTGNQFIYDSTLQGTNCGLVSPMALVVRLGVAYWMSRHGFHVWGGGGSPQPIPNSEDVREFVIRKLRTSGFEFKCNAYYSPRYNFIMWLYVADTDSEPGLYVLVGLDNFSWAVGTLERTSGTIGPDQRPILAAADGYLYQHEDGLDADGAIMKCYIERAPLQIASGSMLGEIQGFATDMQRQTGAMSVEIKTYDRINEGVLDTERIFFDPGEDLIDPSIGGRIARITIRSEALGGDFRLGAPMLEVKVTGKQR